MPRAWSAKDERQYERIKASERGKGSPARAKRIAAATVNQRRRSEGRTKGKSR